MEKHRSPSILGSPIWGAAQITGLYLLIGGLWILFSDQVAARIALDQQMLTSISLYKGWGYVLITAILLYSLIRGHTAALRASEERLHRVIDAMPAFISYVDADRHYQFTNKTYKEWFDDQVEGKQVEEVLGKATYQTASKYIDKVLSGETISYEIQIDFQGNEHFISITYIPDMGIDGRVKGFFVMGLDRTPQKQAEEELRLWADAFEGCYHGIAIDDPHTNRIVVCNPAFAGMLKRSVEEVVGCPVLSLYAPSDYEYVRRQIEKADQIGYVRFESQMTRRGKEGSLFPVQIDVVSVLDENGELLHRVVTAQDISERKSIDEKLKGSEAKYRTLAEHLPAITYISKPDQYVGVTYISPQIEALGFDRNTWLADPELWFRQIHPDDQEQVKAKLQEFEMGAESFKAAYRLRLPNGQTRWFHDESSRVKDEGGKTILKQGFMLDITESKRAEETSQNQQAQITGILNSAIDAIISTDADQRILIFNPAAEVMFRCSQAEAMGQPLGRFIPERWREAHRKHVDNFGRTGVTSRAMRGSAVVYGRRADGEEFPAEASISQVNIDGKKIYTVILRDITERQQAEEYLRRFELLSEHSRDIILFINRENGRILEANAAALQVYGYGRDELLSLSIRDLRADDTETLTANQMAKADAGGILFETIHRRKDGTTFPVEVSSQGATIGGARTLISIIRDITDRKQAEEELERTNQKLNEILASIQDDFYVLDRDWNFVYANRLFASKVGKEPEDFVGNNIWQMFPKHAGTTLEENFRAAMEKRETRRFEIGGKYTSAWYRMTAFPSAEGITVLGTDITERKRTEDALRESEQRLNYAQEIAHLGSWELDIVNNRLTWSDEVYRIFGLQPQESDATYEAFLEAVHPDDRAAVDNAYSSSIREGRDSYEIEHRVVKRSTGEVRIVYEKCEHFRSLDGQILRSVGMVHDITERKRIEKDLQTARDELERKVQERTAALSEANALLQALMDHMPDQIYFKDMQGRFIRNSRSQATLLGLGDPAQAVGKTDFDFFPHAARAYAEEQEVMNSGNPLVDLEEWVVWPDGREMWVSTTKVPLRNAEGQTIGIFGISHDITERKRAEQAIRQLNTDLEKQAEKLQTANKELEAFSYSVSHDLRAPLRAIDGYTRILLEDYEPLLDAEGKRVCSIISREARRMGQLIDDLLAFSRLGRKEMYTSKIDMRTLAVSVLNELLKEEERERIDFHIGKLPTVKGDSSLMRQVWANLLANAIKFTSRKERAAIEVGSKTNKEEIIFYVRDTGAGFDMEYANKLFGVFQRLHSESEFDGTGVGLAIVQRIVHRHEGRVWAEGEVGKGATFYFALPRKEHNHE